MKYFSSLIILFFFMSFMNEGNFQKPVFEVEGHRGCRGLMPENTIPAMLKAIDLGVTTLEMDVVITKDNKVVVSHEPWFGADITTKPDGSFVKPAEAMQLNIYQMSYDEVLKYDVGMKPNPRFPQQQKVKTVKPLLRDLIDSVEAYLVKKNLPKVKYNIETKCLPAGDNRFHPVPSEFVELLMSVIKEKKIEDRVIIQSFDFRTLKHVHEKYTLIKTSMLIEDSDENDLDGQLSKLGYTPEYYSPNHTLVDEKLVKQCHDNGMKIVPWTVNDKKQVKKLKKLGVDGIITDYPNLFK
ncbi:MAG TPA: glycerophosphodiester phosphodiesterase [Chitinophagaceae bacterium]